jgi:hypothetical protein
MHTKICLKSLKENDHSEELGIDGSSIINSSEENRVQDADWADQ